MKPLFLPDWFQEKFPLHLEEAKKEAAEIVIPIRELDKAPGKNQPLL